MRQQHSKAITRALQAALALLSAATLVLFGVLATGVGLDLPLWHGLEAVGPDEGGPAITLPGEEPPTDGRDGSGPGRGDVAQTPGAPAPAPEGAVASATSVAPTSPEAPTQEPNRGPDRAGDGSLVATIGDLRQPPSLPSDSGRAQTDFDPPEIDAPAVVPAPEVPPLPDLPPDDTLDDGPPEAPDPDDRHQEGDDDEAGVGEPAEPAEPDEADQVDEAEEDEGDDDGDDPAAEEDEGDDSDEGSSEKGAHGDKPDDKNITDIQPDADDSAAPTVQTPSPEGGSDSGSGGDYGTASGPETGYDTAAAAETGDEAVPAEELGG